MTFDKSKVYTALNADELKVGSKCIFANCLADLMDAVENDKKVRTRRFTKAFGCDYIARLCDNYGSNFALAYLIEPPVEPKYKPFESIDKAMEVIKEHGGWVENKNSRAQYIVTAKNKDDGLFLLGSYWYSLGDLFQRFIFADDGTPCGELADE